MIAFAHAKKCDGVFACGIIADSEGFADGRVLAEGFFDDAADAFERAMDEGEVGFERGAIFKLLGDLPVCFVALSDDHDAGGVLVQAMNDARAEVCCTDTAQARDFALVR